MITESNTIYYILAPIKVEGGPRYRSEYQTQYQHWDQSSQSKPVGQNQSSKQSRPARSIDERSESSLDTTKSILDGDFYDKVTSNAYILLLS